MALQRLQGCHTKGEIPLSILHKPLSLHHMLDVVRLLNGQEELGTLTVQLQAAMLAISKSIQGLAGVGERDCTAVLNCTLECCCVVACVLFPSCQQYHSNLRNTHTHPYLRVCLSPKM